MNTFRRSPSRWLFVLLVLGAPALTAMLVRLGAPPAGAMTAVVLLTLASVVAMERRAPFRADWSERPADETRTDLVYVALASAPDRAARLAAEWLALSALSLCCAGAPALSLSEAIARGAVAFLLADLGKYAIHRASHERPWLWRFHLAHHQPARIDALNALRLHPVNMAYNAAIDGFAMGLLRVPVSIAAVLATLRAVVGVVQHANLHLEEGGQWLINAPSYHRTHHSVDVDEANHNYGSTLLVWDRLFRTLLRKEAPATVGVAALDHELPKGYVGQTLYPWCARKPRCLALRA
jgi:sterol desaturase/sphingolipid hydroxylase (fatty acid hydroxylase superfamily)